MQPTRSYLICSVQRSGSWLLSHALEDTGVLGIPAEYFHEGDEPSWRQRWGADSEDEFLRAVCREPATGNGVWGAKMMWNYLPAALSRLRNWPALAVPAVASDADVLAAALPGLRFVWLRRADKVRQAISWWRADATGQYALAGADSAAEPPGFDPAAVDRLVRFATACDAGWHGWFTAHAIRPLQLWYEDVSQDPDAAVRTTAAFLDVPLPAGLPRFRPRTRQQADVHTEQFVARYEAR